MAKKRDKKSSEKHAPDNTTETLESMQAQDENSEKEKVDEVADLKDKYLRLFAEFENYKKRTLRERIDLIKTAGQDTIRAFLPVIDDFERAKKSSEQEGSTDTFSEGVELVYQKLLKTVEGLGIKEIDTSDMVFDEELHDAITHLPIEDEDKKGKIIDVIEKGYTLSDKIIRHAKVVVGK